MTAVILAMTTSIDGYATGPDISVEDAMGVGGGVGARIVGRTMHDLGIPHWEDVPYPLPTVVLTHEELPDRQMKSDSFTYVSGIPQSVERVRELAGDKDVLVMGGSNMTQ